MCSSVDTVTSSKDVKMITKHTENRYLQQRTSMSEKWFTYAIQCYRTDTPAKNEKDISLLAYLYHLLCILQGLWLRWWHEIVQCNKDVYVVAYICINTTVLILLFSIGIYTYWLHCTFYLQYKPFLNMEAKVNNLFS